MAFALHSSPFIVIPKYLRRHIHGCVCHFFI